MAISIGRTAFDTPGDVLARPHANCYWLVPGLVLAGEHPGAIDGGGGAGKGRRAARRRHSPVRRSHGGRRAARALRIELARARRSARSTRRPSTVRDSGSRRSVSGVDAHDPGCDSRRDGRGRAGLCALLGGGRPHRYRRRVPAARAWPHGGRGARGHRPQMAVHGKEVLHPRSPEHPEQFAFIERWPGD